ncbi:hypothetical protein WA026_021581, partial [Henosepilachna vigintioctopunctata]
EINYDSPRGGVSVITEKGDNTISYLLVQRARDSDSGKYTCSPSNANPKTLIVHVLNALKILNETICDIKDDEIETDCLLNDDSLSKRKEFVKGQTLPRAFPLC